MIDKLRLAVADFLERAAAEWYRLEITEQGSPPPGALYRSARGLFTLERISDAQLELARASGEEESRIRALLAYLAHGYVVVSSAEELDERWERLETTGTIAGERLSLAAVAPAAAEVVEPEARHRLESEALDRLAEADAMVDALLRAQADALSEIGYGGYVPTVGVLRGVDLDALSRAGEGFLERTDPLYLDLAGWYLPRLAGVRRDEATAADLLRLERAALYDGDYPIAGMLSRVQACVAAMGIAPTVEQRLRVETWHTHNPGRRPRCFAIRVPEEVVVTVPLLPGRRAYSRLLNVYGQGLAMALTGAELPVEDQRLGDAAVPIAFGELLAGLLETPEFLRRVLHVPADRAEEQARLSMLVSLGRLRSRIGRLRVERRAREGADRAEVGDLFEEQMLRATGVRHDARGALWSVRPGIPGAERIRAAQLRGVLGHELRERYDQDWFRNPRSGEALRQWTAPGRRYSASEVATRLTSASLSFEPFERFLAELA